MDIGQGAFIETRENFPRAYDLIVAHLEKGGDILGQNVAFDLGCICVDRPDLIPTIFKAYENGQVKDTMIREKLLAIGEGNLERRRFSLASLVKKYFSTVLEGKTGEDIWRLRYSELDGTPLADWPEEALSYALNDVEWTKKVYEKQTTPKDEDAQARAAWALHLMSVYGMSIDRELADNWLKRVEKDAEIGREVASKLGILRENGTKNLSVLKDMVKQAYSGNPPLTEKGGIKTDVKTLKESGNLKLLEYADSRFAEKLATTYAPIFRENDSVHPYYNVLVKSGRTSCARPNMQNPPRAGGFRECFKPREGYVYTIADYDQIELVGLAQIHIWMFGTSSIADAINGGRDIHLEVAEKLNPEDPAAYRQFAKIANYGFPGGLSARVFCSYAKGYGLDIDEAQAKVIRTAWLDTWVEMRLYFEYISQQTAWNLAEVTQFYSDRLRGKCTFTQMANTLFQGLVADGAKAALFEVSKACYTDTSPLFGSKPVAFLHDEIILESPIEYASEAALELEKIMVKRMKKYIPDVKVGAEGYLTEKWTKKACKVIKEGRIVPWREE